MLNFIKLSVYLLCTAGFIAACHDKVSTHEEAPHQALRIAFEAMPGRLDPRYAVDAYSSRVGSLVFASLTQIRDDGTPRPYISDHWEWDSPTSCTFALREDFYFHDGEALTANDVVATYQSVLDPDSASPKRAALDGILAVTAVGDHTVRFSLSEPNAAFFEAATIGILPARLATAGRIDDVDLVASADADAHARHIGRCEVPLILGFPNAVGLDRLAVPA